MSNKIMLPGKPVNMYSQLKTAMRYEAKNSRVEEQKSGDQVSLTANEDFDVRSLYQSRAKPFSRYLLGEGKNPVDEAHFGGLKVLKGSHCDDDPATPDKISYQADGWFGWKLGGEVSQAAGDPEFRIEEWLIRPDGTSEKHVKA